MKNRLKIDFTKKKFLIFDHFFQNYSKIHEKLIKKSIRKRIKVDQKVDFIHLSSIESNRFFFKFKLTWSIGPIFNFFFKQNICGKIDPRTQLFIIFYKNNFSTFLTSTRHPPPFSTSLATVIKRKNKN